MLMLRLVPYLILTLMPQDGDDDGAMEMSDTRTQKMDVRIESHVRDTIDDGDSWECDMMRDEILAIGYGQ